MIFITQWLDKNNITASWYDGEFHNFSKNDNELTYNEFKLIVNKDIIVSNFEIKSFQLLGREKMIQLKIVPDEPGEVYNEINWKFARSTAIRKRIELVNSILDSKNITNKQLKLLEKLDLAAYKKILRKITCQSIIIIVRHMVNLKPFVL